MAHAKIWVGVWVPALAGLSLTLEAAPALACGGFFCGQQPVDQTAERILFEVGESSVTMTTQISFNGDADDFAWVLPLGEVPLEGSLEVWHQQALNALDANTGPVFLMPSDAECGYAYGCPNCGVPSVDYDAAEAEEPPVQVYVRQEVGEYDVAVIGSEDPAALIDWLHTEGYRITAAMEPYIERYTSEGLKFLALKLLATADVRDLSPFRFTLPGTTPTIPLRMTALAAEPEMSIVTFVLANERFEGKNWANVEIADDQIRYNPGSYLATGVSTNWPRLVAQAVDANDGQGWVTEFAGPSSSFVGLLETQVQNGNFATPEDAEAAADLLGAFRAYPYLTRLYTRVSAEEMTSDPVFGRSTLGDVERQHQLSRFVNGVDQCSEDVRVSTDPCDFATCGAGGLCRPVSVDDAAARAVGMSAEIVVAGCACLPGATARTTFAPDGSPTVICQDGRMSFLNAGDRDEETGSVLPDACAGYDCGEHGQCTAVNMTPTCVCDQGFVAVGSFDSSGARTTRCLAPAETVPREFYDKRLRALPVDLPGGREVVVADAPPVDSSPVMPSPPSGDFPMPRRSPRASADGGCSMAPGTSAAPWLLAGLLAAARARRRRPRVAR
jgi:MYXO-CTERM domain-containing protein